MPTTIRHALLAGVLAAALASVAGALAASSPWTLVKRGPAASAGELAVVGGIVRHPGRVAIRAVVSRPRPVSLRIVVSCRKGSKTGVGGGRLTGTAPYTKAVRLPLAGADNCAVSATGTNPAGSLTLELLRSS